MPYTTNPTFTAGTKLPAASLTTLTSNLDYLYTGIPAATVRMATGQTINIGAVTALVWDSEVSKVDISHSNATNPSRLTINTAGLYSVSVQFTFPNAGSQDRALILEKNGTRVKVNETFGTAQQAFSVTWLVRCAVSDYLEVFYYQGAGTAVASGTAPGTGEPHEFSAVRVAA